MGKYITLSKESPRPIEVEQWVHAFSRTLGTEQKCMHWTSIKSCGSIGFKGPNRSRSSDPFLSHSLRTSQSGWKSIVSFHKKMAMKFWNSSLLSSRSSRWINAMGPMYLAWALEKPGICRMGFSSEIYCHTSQGHTFPKVQDFSSCSRSDRR